MLFPSSTKKDSDKLTLSEFLPLGYLYVLILGIIAESIYYGLIGINFLSYAGILDVLLGPVAILTDKPILLVLLILVGSIFYYLMILRNKKNETKTQDASAVDANTAFLLVMAIMILAAFVGYGLGRGMSERTDIAKNEIEHNTVLYFLNGEKKEVRNLGNTGSFIFYIQKDKENISVAPISNNIMEIELKK